MITVRITITDDEDSVTFERQFETVQDKETYLEGFNLNRKHFESIGVAVTVETLK